VTKFSCEPGAESAGTYSDGSGWRITYDANGNVSVTDEEIAATLERVAGDPGYPVNRAKTKG